MKIFGGRSSLLGDTVMALPLIRVLENLYSGNELTWPIAKKCKQAAPLYINQDGIDSIYITQDEEFLNKTEMDWIKDNFNIFINPTPSHPRETDWYNYRSCVEETMLMCGNEYFEIYNQLDNHYKLPRLNKWWDKPQSFKQEKTIAIHTTAGYGKGLNRSPNTDWWNVLVKEIVNLGYQIYVFGHHNDTPPRYLDHLVYHIDASFFEQVQIAAECNLYIGTDSGFSWIMGALGVPQINLLTNWLPNHYTNFMALAPLNCLNKEKNLFASGGCNNISVDSVLELL